MRAFQNRVFSDSSACACPAAIANGSLRGCVRMCVQDVWFRCGFVVRCLGWFAFCSVCACVCGGASLVALLCLLSSSTHRRETRYPIAAGGFEVGRLLGGTTFRHHPRSLERAVRETVVVAGLCLPGPSLRRCVRVCVQGVCGFRCACVIACGLALLWCCACAAVHRSLLCFASYLAAPVAEKPGIYRRRGFRSRSFAW